MNEKELIKFLRESNSIEGIYTDISNHDLAEAQQFLELKKITIPDLERFVEHFQPGAKLRDKPGMDVRVGNHVPMPGGPLVTQRLEGLLIGLPYPTAFSIHKEYEAIHPFVDCNGRSGRILWLWQMLNEGRKLAPMGFLQTWYYSSLEEVK